MPKDPLPEKTSPPNEITAADAQLWNGTLLKCPGCRLKFPFSAENSPFEYKRFPPRGPGDERRKVPVTHCPHCEGWVAIT